MKIKNTFKNPLLIIIFIAILFRIPQLNSSLWLDEAAQVMESSRSLFQQFDIARDFQPPLIHLIVHFALILGRQEWWLRTIAALIPGLLTIVFTYKIGDLLFNKKVAFWSGLLLSTNSFHIFYSQELRPYSLPAMWGTISWWAMIKLLKKSSIYLQLLFLMSSVLGLYSSYLYPFLVLSQISYLLYLLLTKKGKGKLLNIWKIFPISAIFFLPWLPKFIQQLKVGSSWRLLLPGWDQVVSINQGKAILLVFGKFIFGVIDLDINFFFVSIALVLLAGMIILGYRTFSRISRQKQQYFILIFLWLFIPIISAWIISFIVPVIRPKRMLMLLPSFYLIISISFLSEKNATKISKFLGKLLLLAFLIINLYSSFQYFFNPIYHRENWRQIVKTINQSYGSKKSVLLMSFDEPFAPWQWYDEKREIDIITTGDLYIYRVENIDERIKNIINYDYIIIFDYLRDLTDPQDLLTETVHKFGFEQTEIIDGKNIGFIRIFTKKYNLLSKTDQP